MSRQNPAVGDIRLWRPTKFRSDASVWCDNIHQARIVYDYPVFEGAPMQVERRTGTGWADVPAAELAATDMPSEAIRELYADVLGRAEFEDMHGGELSSGTVSPWPDCGMYSTYLRWAHRRLDALAVVGMQEPAGYIVLAKRASDATPGKTNYRTSSPIFHRDDRGVAEYSLRAHRDGLVDGERMWHGQCEYVLGEVREVQR
ncbi:hypothetical protein [Nocardia aurea]|uniref:hypothetical protein n=1 Tax=Nocardia aurea TaxID=2144174 RepID=UPI0033A908A4